MLKSLEFENFKSWGGRHCLDFGRITGLFGANSSGKSSIIHLLLLLKQTSESQDPDAVLNFGSAVRSYIDFGGFLEIVNEHDLSKQFSFAVDWLPDRQSERYRSSAIHGITLSATIAASVGHRGEEIAVRNLKYQMECSFDADTDGRFRGYHTSVTDALTGILSASLERNGNGAHSLQLEFDGDVYEFSEIDDAHAPTGLYRIAPEDIDVVCQNFELREKMDIENSGIETEISVSSYTIERTIERVLNYTSQLLDRTVYLGPLRDYPRRDYRWTGVAPATVGTRGEQTIQALLADKSARISVVSEWLRQLGVAESLSLNQVGQGARIWEPLVVQQDGSTLVNLADVGFGVSQILPVIVALLSAPSGSLVVLEHPDIHLHPKAQSELADLLIKVANTKDIQILIESHSEHLLARIQRRIAESTRGDGGLKAEDVRLYFCEQRQGRSKLTPLEMLPSGVITNWPDDFFGDMLAERMALSGFYPKSDDRATDG